MRVSGRVDLYRKSIACGTSSPPGPCRDQTVCRSGSAHGTSGQPMSGRRLPPSPDWRIGLNHPWLGDVGALVSRLLVTLGHGLRVDRGGTLWIPEPPAPRHLATEMISMFNTGYLQRPPARFYVFAPSRAPMTEEPCTPPMSRHPTAASQPARRDNAARAARRAGRTWDGRRATSLRRRSD